MRLWASRLSSCPRATRAAACAAILAACCAASGAACGGGGSGSHDGASSSSSSSSGSSPSDGGGIISNLPDAAVAELLGRWWGRLPAPASNGDALAALDVVRAAGGGVTATLWFAATAHPTLITATADPTQFTLAGQGLLTLGQDTLTLQTDVEEPDGAMVQGTATFTRSHALLVHPGVFSIRPTVFSADGSALAYFVDLHPWEWDAAGQTLLDLEANVDAGTPPMGVAVSPQVAVSPDGSRTAYCINPGTTTLPPLYVFDRGTTQALQIADYAPCGAPSFSFSADGKRLAARAAASPYSGTASMELRVWDFAAGSMTAVPNTASVDEHWLGASGRYLFTATGVVPPSTTSYMTLNVYDVDARTTTPLGGAAWVTRSGDNRYVAFVGSGGKVVVWSDDAGAATQLEVVGPGDVNISPFRLSPDGQKIQYTDANQNLRVLTFGSPTSAVAAKSVTCAVGSPPTPFVTGVFPGSFSADSRALAAVAPGAGPCDTSGLTPEAVHLFDIASATDHSFALPAVTATESAGLVAASSSAVVYEYSNIGAMTEMHMWSTADGDRMLPLDFGDGLVLYAALSQDSSRLLFASGVGQPPIAYLWDRTAGAVPLVTFSGNPLPPFFATLSAQSGVALGYDGTSKAFVVARPGSPPAPWVQGVDVHVVSASGDAFAVAGTAGNDQGLFAISLLSGKAGFLEGGRLVAATDTHVYFFAADGLCEIPTP